MKVVQEYKQTEIGLLPSDWEVKTLMDVLINTKLGGNYNNFDVETEFPLIKMGNISRGFININKLQYVTDKTNISEDDLLRYGDVLFNTRNTLELVGKVAIWRNELPRAYFNSNILRFKFNDKFISSNFFMNLVLNQPSSIYQFKGIATGTTSVAAIYNRDLINILVQVPTLEEQTLIATALSNADDWITNLENLVNKKRHIKQGALQELLKPKKGWEVKKLGVVGECIIGLTYSPDNVTTEGKLVLRSSNVKDNKLVYSDTVFVNVEVSEKLITRKGDILICVRNGSRNLIGKCAYIDGRGVGETFGAFMSVFRSNYNAYIFQVFQSNIIKKQIEEHLGATINQITNKSLNSFQIPFPTIKEQEYIVAILSDMDAEIEQLETKLEKAKKVKQGMMQELLTGKTRLV